MKFFGFGRRKPNAWKGAIAGVAGGLAGAFVMNTFQALEKKAEDALSPPQTGNAPAGDDATMKTADALAEAVGHAPLTPGQKATGGPIVHYVFGGLMGGAYGVAAEYSELARAGLGTAFGSALFVGADEVAVPALGLGESPLKSPPAAQIKPWIAHLVYGSTVELVRRAVRKLV